MRLREQSRLATQGSISTRRSKNTAARSECCRLSCVRLRWTTRLFA